MRRSSNSKIAHRRFDNSAAGHKKLIHWLGTHPVRVVLEASGAYSLDLALALHRAESVEVMVANPRALKDYRRSKMERSKTDKVDATIICDYAYRMEFVPWQVPAPEVFELRQMARRIQTYVDDRTAARNRLHAAMASTTTCRVILVSCKRRVSGVPLWNSLGEAVIITSHGWAIALPQSTRGKQAPRLALSKAVAP